MNTETIKETSTVIENQDLKLLVLFNDDVNTFNHVIDMLVKYCGQDSLQAEQCAMLVHFKGKCDIKMGAYKELVFISEILAENGLTVEIK